jgi:class 3 adenylate cyclase
MPSFSSSLKNDIEERIGDRKDTIDERLEEISSGQTKPRLESLTLHSAKEYRLGMVFVDINDFSGYISRNSDEETLFMLNLFVPEAMELVRDYDGKLEKNTGDGILAYFGAGDDDNEAVEILLEYLATLKWSLANQINPILDNKDIETITISAGAAYSSVYVSRIGAHSGNQQMNRLTAVSSGANAASELEDMAGTNQYFVNDGIYKNSDKEDGWGQYLYDRGRHEGYLWGGEKAHYYNFKGIWGSTETNNLR